MAEKGYNKLTQQLLAEGYTAEHFPDYVKVDTSRFTGNDPLHNLGGGFVYHRYISDRFVYKTGCGKYVLGKNVIQQMSHMGVEWTHENDNPVFRCPYDCAQCEHNDEKLHGMHGGGLCIHCFCTCHRTEEGYDYENSIEKAERERQDEKEEKYLEFVKEHNGRVCENHAYYDERTRTWSLRYEPYNCANMCFAKDGYCPILGRQLSKKRGNVYYDLKKSSTRLQEGRQASLFDGIEDVSIVKGIRYFKKPVSMDIAESFVKLQKDSIYSRLYWNFSEERFANPTFQFEVLNVRAEAKPSRDLLQDLEDIKAGITIIHDSDMEKRTNELKKDRRKKTAENRVKRLEKKILEVGYESLEEHSLDRVHADKWLTEERLAELESIRLAKLTEVVPVQMSLF